MADSAITVSIITGVTAVVTSVIAIIRTREKARAAWPDRMVARIEELEKRERVHHKEKAALLERIVEVEHNEDEWRRLFSLLKQEHQQVIRELEAERHKNLSLEGKAANLEQQVLLLQKQNAHISRELGALYMRLGEKRPPSTPPPELDSGSELT